MASKKQDETTGPGGDSLRAVSSQFRTAAGLADKELGSPSDPARHEKGGTSGSAEALKVTGPAKANVEDVTQTSPAKEMKADSTTETSSKKKKAK